MSSPVQKTIERDPAQPLSTNVHLLNWVDKMAALTKPADLVFPSHLIVRAQLHLSSGYHGLVLNCTLWNLAIRCLSW